ncbi:sensor domain-containing diguanylate cyclase [Neptunomonas antarctica]|uniref:Diguanylate cyclase with GAF sensor n=1 Tax=Neptunomonas antarctica TaxID=619304 RepID=A0A1N7N5M9_9GAMM|nr:sensor domain-containing diguanylate cyclase [Neptunomonas antarctica]SIS93630.1 diguanylate cyclase with GAF sensor [Neptunomonas antarctica]
MKKPDTTENEEARLKTLRSLDILDTPAEERFDRLTRLAKHMFDVPIALVSLIDEQRQWFKSSVGLDVRETSREISFCGHAILSDEVFIVEDAAEDERFADNPLVLQAPYIRFYAGCPLRHLDGSTLGTLCIIDTKSRIFNKEDMEALRDLAALAERELAAVQLATLDELTKISNRRGFIMLSQQTLKMCSRTKISASLIFLDMNDFKLINDKWGHAEGDSALLSFAKIMGDTFRDSDIFARIGGDEFAVLLTNTSLKQANESIDRFRLAVDKFNKAAHRGYDLLFCEGVVEFDYKKKDSVETLMKQADALMYEKKSQF